MAQPAKIEELRFRLKADPKSRLFFPLAEELRKAAQLDEAEGVLRTGLTNHPAYLSAWVSLGRVLRDQQKHGAAVEPLTKALQIDPENVVAARLLADAYLALGEKVEAIKKYKLVHALLPADEEVEATIQRLSLEVGDAPALAVSAAPQETEIEPVHERTNPEPLGTVTTPDIAPTSPDGDVFDVTYSRLQQGMRVEEATGDSEPMSAAHEESPFEEPAADTGYSADAFAIEEPSGSHIGDAPLAAEESSTDESDVFEPSEPVAPGFIQGVFGANVPPPPPEADDFAKTITMADLYAEQGLIDEARDIYEDILARDPDNAVVLERVSRLGVTSAPAPALEEVPPVIEEERGNPKVKKLERWLARVGKKEAGGV